MRAKLDFADAGDNAFLMTVTPVSKMWKKKTRVITNVEYNAILHWQRNDITIQQALPHWSAGEREVLLSGMDDDEWDKAIPKGDD